MMDREDYVIVLSNFNCAKIPSKIDLLLESIFILDSTWYPEGISNYNIQNTRMKSYIKKRMQQLVGVFDRIGNQFCCSTRFYFIHF